MSVPRNGHHLVVLDVVCDELHAHPSDCRSGRQARADDYLHVVGVTDDDHVVEARVDTAVPKLLALWKWG